MSNIQKSNSSTLSVLKSDKVAKRFETILGDLTRANSFLVSVINAVQNSPLLKNCDPSSILFAAATAASLDLPVNSNLGLAYLIPYNNKQPDGSFKTQCQFQMGYKGYIQLAIRTGQFKTIAAEVVYEGQVKSHDRLKGIEFDWDGKISDKVIGFAGFFSLTNGFEKTLYMTVEEMQNHGVSYSKNFKNKYSLWQTDFETMGKKTALKLVLSKFAPVSIEFQNIAKANVVDQAVINDFEAEDIEYVDASQSRNVLDEGLVARRKELDNLKDHISKSKSLEDLNLLLDSVQGDKQMTEMVKIAIDELSNSNTKTTSNAAKRSVPKKS